MIKKLTVYTFVLFGLAACGDDLDSVSYGIPGPAGKDGAPVVCTVVDMGPSVEISCPGSPTVTINDGADGKNGIDGANGEDGQSCSVVSVDPDDVAPNGGALITCGESTVLLINGAPGQNGQDGQDGSNGEDGNDGSDGQDGVDGEDAPSTALVISALIDPCGNDPVKQDEIILKLSDGSLIASFSSNGSALNTRLVSLSAGNYTTTDGTGCQFSVDGNGNVSW